MRILAAIGLSLCVLSVGCDSSSYGSCAPTDPKDLGVATSSDLSGRLSPCYPSLTSDLRGVTPPDMFKPCNLHGKVKFVSGFATYKIQIVTSFPDIRVQKVTGFADDPGKWQEVTGFEDFSVEVVTSFPDFKVEYVTSFPGCP